MKLKKFINKYKYKYIFNKCKTIIEKKIIIKLYMSSKKYTKNQLIQIAKKNNISLKNRENKMKTKEQLFGSLYRKKLLKGGMSDKCKNELTKLITEKYKKIKNSIIERNKMIILPIIIPECRDVSKIDIFKLICDIVTKKEKFTNNTSGISYKNNLRKINEKQLNILEDLMYDKLNSNDIIKNNDGKKNNENNFVYFNAISQSDSNNGEKNNENKFVYFNAISQSDGKKNIKNNDGKKNIENNLVYNINDFDFNFGPLSFISLSIIFGKLDTVLKIENIENILTKQYPIIKDMSLNSIGYCIFTNDDVNLNKILEKFKNEKLFAAQSNKNEQEALEFALFKYFDYKEEWKTKKNNEQKKSDEKLKNLKKSYNIVMDLYNYYDKQKNMDISFCKSYIKMSKTINKSYPATSTRTRYSLGFLKKNTNNNREKLNKITDIIIGKAKNKFIIQTGGFYEEAFCYVGNFFILVLIIFFFILLVLMTGGEAADPVVLGSPELSFLSCTKPANIKQTNSTPLINSNNKKKTYKRINLNKISYSRLYINGESTNELYDTISVARNNPIKVGTLTSNGKDIEHLNIKPRTPVLGFNNTN